jgi:hypothetical protein
MMKEVFLPSWIDPEETAREHLRRRTEHRIGLAHEMPPVRLMYRDLCCAMIRLVWDRFDPEAQAFIEEVERASWEEFRERRMSSWHDRLAACGAPLVALLRRYVGQIDNPVIDGPRHTYVSLRALTDNCYESGPIQMATSVAWLLAENYRRGPDHPSRAGAFRQANRVVLTTIVCVMGPGDAYNYVLDPSIETVWRFRDGLIWETARALRAERRTHEFFILADMLQDAGCPDGMELQHLLEPCEHQATCWAVRNLANKVLGDRVRL